MTEAKKTIKETVKFYNCALIMSMTDKVEPGTIKEILIDADSIFDSLKSGTLSFEDCAEDIRKNLEIEVTI